MINISIFCLDDDQETLDLIKEDFDKAGIVHYHLFTNEREFLKSFNENVHVAVIDHYLSGSTEIGYDIMETIFELNHKFHSPLKCKMIIMSGQQDPAMIAKYLNNGAFRYLRKDDKDFSVLLIDYVKQAIDEVETFFAAYNRLLAMRCAVNS